MDGALAAGFDHYRVARVEQRFGERGSFGLEKRLAASDFDETNVGAAAGSGGKRAYSGNYLIESGFLAAVKRIGGIAPNAAQIAAGEADENAGQARASPFALNRAKNFSDLHCFGRGACASSVRSDGRNKQLRQNPPPLR